MSMSEEGNYFEVPANSVMFLSSSPCDVYIRIKKRQGADHYVKRIYSGDFFTTEEIQGYMVKHGLSHFYVETKFLQLFNTHLFKTVVDQMEDAKRPSELRLGLTQVATELVAGGLQQGNGLSISPEILALSKATMRSVVTLTANYGNLGSLIRQLVKNQASYRFKHIQLITGITVSMMQVLDWGKKELEANMSFVSLFHDISLEKDEWCKIRDNKELFNSDLSDAEKKAVKNHAQRACELIHPYPKIPMGADSIIRQHHGTLNGSGFSETFGQNISPATVVFILAEDFVDSFLMKQEAAGTGEVSAADIFDIWAYLEKKYDSGRFKKILGHMKELPLLATS